MRKRYWIITATAFSFLVLLSGIVFLWFWLFGDEVFNENGVSGDLASSLGITIGENGNWYVSGTDTGVCARGDDGFTPYVGTNGNWWIGTRDTRVSAVGAEGERGADGKDGATVEIGENGNWFIGGKDTGIKAVGEDGSEGAPGADGKDGTTVEIGDNGNWFIDGIDSGIKAEATDGKDGANGKNGENGKDGLTPYIATNGNWWIGETDTGIKAEGTAGKNGANGENGANGKDGLTPYIAADGNWWIGDKDTGIKAVGTDGKNGTNGKNGENGIDGKDGLTPYVGDDGTWWIGDKSTGIKAEGTDGANGNGIAEMKISEGYLYVRYTNSPAAWINLGKLTSVMEYSLRFYPLADGTLGVGAGDLLYVEDITVPAEHDGKNVSAIIPYGFSGALNLKSVKLPESLNSIGESAFSGAVRLSEIIIPKSVTTVGANAFSGCEALIIKLEAESIPDGWNPYFNPSNCDVILGYGKDVSVTSDGFKFKENSDGDIVITEYVGSASFLEIPEKIDGKTVVSIDSGAFSGRSNLLRITLPSTLINIREDAFSDCFKLIEIYNLSSLTVTAGSSENGGIAQYAAHVYNSKESISILKEQDEIVYVESEGEIYAFAYIGDSEEVVLPNKITGKNYKVADYFLFGNVKVKRLVIGEGVVGIGTKAFAECTALSEIIFGATECNALVSSAEAFSGSCSNASVTVSKNVTSIPAYLFASSSSENAPNIVSVEFEEGAVCTVIDVSAFRNITSLVSVTLSETVSSIGAGAFFGCGLEVVYGALGKWRVEESVRTFSTPEAVAEALKSSNKYFNRNWS